MAFIEVTATIHFSYDTEDSPVTNVDEARDDVWSMLSNGDLNGNDFHIETVTA